MDDISPIARRPSFISQRAMLSYGELAHTMHAESKDVSIPYREVVCPISHEDLSNADMRKWFGWFPIGGGRGAMPKIYSVTALKSYFDMNQQHMVVPDPFRILPNIAHMRPRLNRYVGLSDEIKAIPASDVTTEYKCNLLNELLDLWIAGHANARRTHLQELGLLYNMSIYDTLNYVHNYSDSKHAKSLLSTLPIGSFLLRRSSMSNVNGVGDITIFTISYKISDQSVYNTRCLDIHGVGIYYISYAADYKGGHSIVSDNALMTGDINAILSELNYGTPNHACVTDMLVDFSERNLIDLKLFNSDKKINLASADKK